MIRLTTVRSQHILSMYMRYREVMEKKTGGAAAPKRIIFYRGSFSSLFLACTLDSSDILLCRRCL